MNNNKESYYSIERLVDFGISMAVAQQMISGFQHAMTQASPTQTIPQQPMANRVYFAIVNDVQVGPLSIHDLIRMVRDRELHAGSLLWIPGNPSWLPASSFAEIMTIVAAAPPPVTE